MIQEGELTSFALGLYVTYVGQTRFTNNN